MKWYTVEEAKQIIGISDKAIYKAIQDGKLKGYTKKLKGKTYISKDGIQDVWAVEEEKYNGENAGLGLEVESKLNELNESRKSVDKSINIQEDSTSGPTNQTLLETMQSMIETLQLQLESKDREIESLHRIIEKQQDNEASLQEKLGNQQKIQALLEQRVVDSEKHEEENEKETINKRKWFRKNKK